MYRIWDTGWDIVKTMWKTSRWLLGYRYFLPVMKAGYPKPLLDTAVAPHVLHLLANCGEWYCPLLSFVSAVDNQDMGHACMLFEMVWRALAPLWCLVMLPARSLDWTVTPTLCSSPPPCSSAIHGAYLCTLHWGTPYQFVVRVPAFPNEWTSGITHSVSPVSL